jgi:hypothetical protein
VSRKGRRTYTFGGGGLVKISLRANSDRQCSAFVVNIKLISFLFSLKAVNKR